MLGGSGGMPPPTPPPPPPPKIFDKNGEIWCNVVHSGPSKVFYYQPKNQQF